MTTEEQYILNQYRRLSTKGRQAIQSLIDALPKPGPAPPEPDPTYVRAEIDANPVWQLAFRLSEVHNDHAPLGWSHYIGLADWLIQHYTMHPREYYTMHPREAQ